MKDRRARWWWVAGLAIAVAIVVLLAPLASRDPDGLNKVAQDAGFLEKAQNFFRGLFSGYWIPGVGDPTVSKILSGLLGIAIVTIAIFVLGRLLARRSR
jgi:hypothetical protein